MVMSLTHRDSYLPIAVKSRERDEREVFGGMGGADAGAGGQSKHAAPVSIPPKHALIRSSAHPLIRSPAHPLILPSTINPPGTCATARHNTHLQDVFLLLLLLPVHRQTRVGSAAATAATAAAAAPQPKRNGMD
ncbi:hypothetical protein B2J93_9622 [Marssonina coronariae]|uniref:Uncharacterized protein n=1 Tax=Diplocarpon coronariae TaxID=2795749 RepID=A0A218ZFS4_9HELO|nr:hypothetical protein B2J93_9622 [Marssonina coronariae]